jgi:hypothetical protein
MPIDASIYGLQKTPEMPSYLDAQTKAMGLSQMGMQQAQAMRQAADQRAVRDAISQNVNQDGSLNQPGALSYLAKSAPHLIPQQTEQFAKVNKDTSEAGLKQNELAQASASQVGAIVDHLKGLPFDQAQKLYPAVRQLGISAKAFGASDAPEQLTPEWLDAVHARMQGSKPYLENQKTISETAMAPAKLNAELFGSRSPNAELSSQYNKDIAPIRGSQGAMNQMLDNYKHPSPQGDASLVLNAFKIKFPNAPDVNSLKELSESQAASDHWKNMATKALSGGFDQPTRDNLMRDAASTYRANVDTYKGIQERYNARARQQNVNDPTLTYEPAIQKTFDEAMKLQDQIGPYVPPSQRGGIMGKVMGSAQSMLGLGGGTQSAVAAPPPISPEKRKAALDWINKNPNDPRVKTVNQLLGGSK